MAKNGEQHIASLRDGRQIFLDGTLIEDHVAHPAFCRSIQSVAAMYDFQGRNENLRRMTFLSRRLARR
jgi:4-hydroxyphenylacetate 3-monooxygenase